MKNEIKYPKTFETKRELENWLDSYDIQHKDCYVFRNSDYVYTDLKGFDHLFRNGKELTKGLEVTWVCSFDSGEWAYEDMEGNLHRVGKDNNLIR